MGILIMAGQLILSLTILVFLHELGHYLAARAFGIRVEKFYIFFDAFNVKLISFKRGGTEYGIGWLPLGGYVKIAGMIDESMDKEQMKRPAQPDEFRSKPAWQRFIVMVAGIVMNIIFGVIFMSVYLGGFQQTYTPVEAVNQDGIYATEFGRDLGFQDGDELVAVNGRSHRRLSDFESLRVALGADVTVRRDGEEVVIPVPSLFPRIQSGQPTAIFDVRAQVVIDSVLPNSFAADGGLRSGDTIRAVETTDVKTFSQFKEVARSKANGTVSVLVDRGARDQLMRVRVDSAGRMGFIATVHNPYDGERYTLGRSLRYGLKDAVNDLVVNVMGFGKIFQGEVSARDSVASPIGIAKMFGATWDWARFWRLTALISIILAFMNILPIPALDGGHMMFLTIEMLTGRPVSDRVMEVAQVIGIILLLSLMVFAFGNDILKSFGI